MLLVASICIALVALTMLMHYDVLRVLSLRLPTLALRNRTKLLVVVAATFLAHTAEMAVYGTALYVLVTLGNVGDLGPLAAPTLANCLYFSAETYTSLGFGDITPRGPLRLLAGIEALNGLLLIGWSASYIFLEMDRFWHADARVERNSWTHTRADTARNRAVTGRTAEGLAPPHGAEGDE